MHNLKYVPLILRNSVHNGYMSIRRCGGCEWCQWHTTRNRRRKPVAVSGASLMQFSTECFRYWFSLTN